MTGVVVVAAVVGIMVAAALVQLVVSKGFDLLGQGVTKARRGPAAQGFVALEAPAPRVLAALSASGNLSADGLLTTRSGRSVEVSTGWQDGKRGLECRWGADVHGEANEIMRDVAATVECAGGGRPAPGSPSRDLTVDRRP